MHLCWWLSVWNWVSFCKGCPKSGFTVSQVLLCSSSTCNFLAFISMFISMVETGDAVWHFNILNQVTHPAQETLLVPKHDLLKHDESFAVSLQKSSSHCQDFMKLSILAFSDKTFFLMVNTFILFPLLSIGFCSLYFVTERHSFCVIVTWLCSISGSFSKVTQKNESWGHE